MSEFDDNQNVMPLPPIDDSITLNDDTPYTQSTFNNDSGCEI